MKKLLPSLTLLIASVLSACSTVNTYQEPNSPQTALIKLTNKNLINQFSRQLILKPNNSLYFASIDGQPPAFSTGDSLRVSAGKHSIEINCSVNGRTFGHNTLVINAQPQRTYTISYPEYMEGYTVDLNACQKLEVK